MYSHLIDLHDNNRGGSYGYTSQQETVQGLMDSDPSWLQLPNLQHTEHTMQQVRPHQQAASGPLRGLRIRRCGLAY